MNLNNIDYNSLKNDENISVQIGKEIERLSWIKSPFESFTGKGGDRGVRTFSVENDQPYRPRLKNKLTGAGVEGNADFKTNYDELEILNQTIYPKVVGNALRSPIRQYSKMQSIDFVKESVDSLSEWMQDRRDKAIVAHLCNDFTNVVAADAQNGFKDYKKSPEDTTKQIAKGDVCSVKLLRRAIFMARSGTHANGKEAFPIKPIKADRESVNGISVIHNSYLILLESHQIQQLKADKEWREMQAYAGDRGDKNRLFTGFVGMIDNCPILDMGVWTKMQVGMPNTDLSDADFKHYLDSQNVSKTTPPSFYADKQPLSIGALIGASAIVMAGSNATKFYIDDTQDSGRKVVCGADRLLSIAKGRFSLESGALSPFSNQDFATIGIFSSKE
ncbi:DUF4043 family protein [Helicobacter sp. MIT 05-5293]|uniref:phage capsid family protein n=1 Tax=unclassified Helicobacter TaxID=2593540 RepID=UPI00051D6491|nr:MULTISPECIES: DUF4043 family protein [unclassified Helicobacter]TLD79840.1 DUF4043 family protein [Helicobacter sp. MIT 05-5293]TLD85439.1 DUF4043 family protein [Helicobacter sp. MIT 05-5294]